MSRHLPGQTPPVVQWLKAFLKRGVTLIATLGRRAMLYRQVSPRNSAAKFNREYVFAETAQGVVILGWLTMTAVERPGLRSHLGDEARAGTQLRR